jgi:hypothetical protein
VRLRRMWSMRETLCGRFGYGASFPTARTRVIVNGVTHAGQAPRMAAESRRCALWVNPESFSRAQELADLLGVDVDTFIDFAVTSIHEDVTAEGQLPVRANSRMVTGHVTDLDRFRPRMQ